MQNKVLLLYSNYLFFDLYSHSLRKMGYEVFPKDFKFFKNKEIKDYESFEKDIINLLNENKVEKIIMNMNWSSFYWTTEKNRLDSENPDANTFINNNYEKYKIIVISVKEPKNIELVSYINKNNVTDSLLDYVKYDLEQENLDLCFSIKKEY